MACATLKRSLDFDPLALHSPSSRSPKRRRCMPVTMSTCTPPKNSTSAAFSEASSKLSTEAIAANLAAEIKRIHRRRQLQYPGSCQDGGSSPGPSEMSDSSSDTDCASSQSQALFGALSPSKKDLPLFTFRQVSLFCERMLKEREDQIREDYDKVLTCKLAEQYEAFLKFNHDQLQRRYNELPMSYVS